MFIQGQQVLKLTMFAFDGKRIDKQKPVDRFFKKNIVLVLTEITGTNETQLSDNSANSKLMNFFMGKIKKVVFLAYLFPQSEEQEREEYELHVYMQMLLKILMS